MNRSLRDIALVLAIGVFSTGCASRAKPSHGSPEFEKPILELGPKLPPNGFVTADQIEGPALAGGMRVFAVLNEDGQLLESVGHSTSETTLHGASRARAIGDARIEYLNVDDDGNVVMTAVIDHKEQVLTIFEPPLVVAWARLEPGETRSSKSRMRVVNLNDQNKVREQGSATQRITYANDQHVTTPLGEFIAQRVEMEFRADLNLADAREQTTLFTTPEWGVIAEQIAEEIKVLGAFGRKTTRTNVLMITPSSR